jgi:hypothetical protein
LKSHLHKPLERQSHIVEQEAVLLYEVGNLQC